MPKPRTRTKTAGSHKAKPKVYHPPQPPKWTLRSYGVSVELDAIKVVLYNDTPNVLTLAYTLRKPYDHPSTLATPTQARSHHITYELRGTVLVNQQENGAVLEHTFYTYPPEGHHILYCMAFDTTSFATHHSISPILAFEYDLVLGPVNFSPVIPSSGGQYHADIGDFILVDTYNSPLPPPAPSGSGFDLQSISGPNHFTGIQYSPIGPPYHPIGATNYQTETWKLNVTASSQTIANIGLRQARIYGPPAPPAFSVYSESWLTAFDPSTGLGIQQVVNYPFLTRDGDLALFYLTGPSVTLNPPAWQVVNGMFLNYGGVQPFDITTFGTTPITATAQFTAYVFYASALQLTVTNVTKGWKLIPALPVP